MVDTWHANLGSSPGVRKCLTYEAMRTYQLWCCLSLQTRGFENKIFPFSLVIVFISDTDFGMSHFEICLCIVITLSFQIIDI